MNTLSRVTLRTWFALVCTAFVFGPSVHADCVDLTIHTDRGPVAGIQTESGRRFLGIPYAAPPVGAQRWRPPQTSPSWQATRDATQFGANCPQAQSPFGAARNVNEDCLFLNVYTPPVGPLGAAFRHAPVLVWIHGGAGRAVRVPTTTRASSWTAVSSW
jgi:para-nitrobenzyl esterase